MDDDNEEREDDDNDDGADEEADEQDSIHYHCQNLGLYSLRRRRLILSV